MTTLNGWAGKVLKVDLSNGMLSTEDLEKYEPEKFIGGRGLTAKIFWDNVDAATNLKLMDDPLAPESLLAIAVGPVAGTLAPSSSRVELGGVAPGVYPQPWYTRSGMGGSWGPELRYAGFDALYIVGKAETPVYVWIEDGKAELRDATELWGLDTFETQRFFYNELGSDVKVLCIGQAGENLVRISTIMSDTGSSFGQGGFASVWGAKNLKAIVVKGSGGVKVADPDRLIELSEHTQNLVNREKQGQPCQYYPKPYFSKYHSPMPEKFMADLEKAQIGWYACQSCPIGCRAHLDIPGAGEGHVMCLDWFTIMLGAVNKDAFKGNKLGNKYGLNFWMGGALIGVLGAAARAGYLTDENTGLPFSTPGGTYSPVFINAMLEATAFRRGLGDKIAEGLPRLAYYIAEEYNAPSFVTQGDMFGAHGMSSHWADNFPVNALAWAVDSRDPYVPLSEYTLFYSMKVIYATREQKVAAATKAYGSEKALDFLTFDDKAEVVKHLEERGCVKCSLVLCDNLVPMLMDQYTDEHQGDLTIESKLYSAVTGIETSEDEMNVNGERIFNLERAIMVREGRRRQQDQIAPMFTVPRNKSIWYGTYEEGTTKEEGTFVDPDIFNTTFLDHWYSLMGWTNDGVPTRSKLEELGMKDVADKLGV